MEALQVIICDNDQNWLKQASEIIAEQAEQMNRQLRIRCFDQTVSVLEELTETPDVFFMDIEFDNGPEGITLAGKINQHFPNCQIVYLTNYLHYALDVYQTEHIWYVLKSQLTSRLPEIFDKLRQLEASKKAALVVTSPEGKIVHLSCSEIIYMERQHRLTHIVMESDTIDTRSRIPELLEKLPQGDFARCHNSYIVSLPHVREIHAGSLILDNRSEILISRSYNKKFRNAYMKWAESIVV